MSHSNSVHSVRPHTPFGSSSPPPPPSSRPSPPFLWRKGCELQQQDGEEEEEGGRGAGAGVLYPLGGPAPGDPVGDPVQGAVPVAVPLQVRVDGVAGALLRPSRPQEVAADALRLLLLPAIRGPQLPLPAIRGPQLPQPARRGPQLPQPLRRGRPLVDPSLPFLGDDYEGVMLLNCCGGILLCQGRNRTLEILEYFVCNPATEKIWAVLPPPDVPEPSPYNFYLGFDPAVPSRFVVFKFIQEGHGIVRVYSSDTGEWTSTASGRHIVQYVGETLCAFFNDALHFTAYDKGDDKFYPEWESIPSIFTVNADGDTWRRFPVPSEVCFSFIGQSQGRLYGINIDNVKDCMLSVWDLKDYASGHWTLKHTASILKLLGRPYCELGEQYLVAAVHPECNLIFLVGWMRSQKTLMSYDMDSQKLHVICTLDDYQMTKLRPYIPCFAEWPPSEAH